MDRRLSKKFFLLSSIAMVVFCFSAGNVFAKVDNFVITEVMYSPDGPDKGFEWLEIFNSSSSKISAPKSGLGLIDEAEERDAAGKLKNTCHTFDRDLEIVPGEFAIIADSKANFQNTYPDYSGKILDSVLDLNNTEDTVKISFDRCATWETEVAYSKNWGADGNGRTLEKINFEKSNEKSNWQESFVLGGTPGEKSSEKKTFSRKIKISELLPNPSGEEEKEEFIEIFNEDGKDIDLSGWTIEDKSGNFYIFPKTLIGAREYLVIYRSVFRFALNNTGEEIITLKDANGEEAEKVAYAESAKENYSYAYDDGKFQWTSTATPGKMNVITRPQEETSSEENLPSAEKVILNEIFPNPKTDEKNGEFIEILNNETFPVDLYGWIIKDASKTGKYVFKEHVTIKPGDYLAIYRPQFKIALNNSKESVYLYNPQGKITSSVSYEKSFEGASYNFDGTNWPASNALSGNAGWRWSKFLTPGSKNKFDSPPLVRLTKPKNAYKNTLAKFRVRAKDKETKRLKYTWDFGDGHKSYLKKTSHKYLKTGKYTVKLVVRDDSQTVEKIFPLVVKKYPRPKLEIVKLVPNPKGLDSQNETLTLRNASGKKVSLQNFKIATGSKNLVNHPVYKNIILDPGEEKIIARTDSKITLNNKAGKVALLYPDGKTADELVYAKDKISDNESYEKIDGKWQWKSPPDEAGKENDSSAKNSVGNNEELGAVKGVSTKKESIFSILRPLAFQKASAFLEKLKLIEQKNIDTSCHEKPLIGLPQLAFFAPLSYDQ